MKCFCYLRNIQDKLSGRPKTQLPNKIPGGPGNQAMPRTAKPMRRTLIRPSPDQHEGLERSHSCQMYFADDQVPVASVPNPCSARSTENIGLATVYNTCWFVCLFVGWLVVYVVCVCVCCGLLWFVVVCCVCCLVGLCWYGCLCVYVHNMSRQCKCYTHAN